MRSTAAATTATAAHRPRATVAQCGGVLERRDHLIPDPGKQLVVAASPSLDPLTVCPIEHMAIHAHTLSSPHLDSNLLRGGVERDATRCVPRAARRICRIRHVHEPVLNPNEGSVGVRPPVEVDPRLASGNARVEALRDPAPELLIRQHDVFPRDRGAPYSVAVAPPAHCQVGADHDEDTPSARAVQGGASSQVRGYQIGCWGVGVSGTPGRYCGTGQETGRSACRGPGRRPAGNRFSCGLHTAADPPP